MAVFDFFGKGKDKKTEEEATEALKKMREKKKKGLGKKVAEKALTEFEKRKKREKELLESL